MLLRWSRLGWKKAYRNRITWLPEPTSYIQTLPKSALFKWTHENLANICKRSTSKISHVVRYSIQNLTRCKKVDSKSDKTKKNSFKIWQDKKFLIQNHAFNKNFFIQIHAFWKKIYIQKHAFHKKFFLQNRVARKTQFLRILWGKLNEKMIFCLQGFFQNLIFKINFFSKSVLFRNVSFEIMLFKFFFFKNRSVLNFLNSKSNALYFFQSNSDAL